MINQNEMFEIDLHSPEKGSFFEYSSYIHGTQFIVEKRDQETEPKQSVKDKQRMSIE